MRGGGDNSVPDSTQVQIIPPKNQSHLSNNPLLLWNFLDKRKSERVLLAHISVFCKNKFTQSCSTCNVFNCEGYNIFSFH